MISKWVTVFGSLDLRSQMTKCFAHLKDIRITEIGPPCGIHPAKLIREAKALSKNFFRKIDSEKLIFLYFCHLYQKYQTVQLLVRK